MQRALAGLPSVGFLKPNPSEIPRGHYIRDGGRSSTYATTQTTYRYRRPTATTVRRHPSTMPPATTVSPTSPAATTP
jgi:hypothetical protein